MEQHYHRTNKTIGSNHPLTLLFSLVFFLPWHLKKKVSLTNYLSFKNFFHLLFWVQLCILEDTNQRFVISKKTCHSVSQEMVYWLGCNWPQNMVLIFFSNNTVFAKVPKMSHKHLSFDAKIENSAFEFWRIKLKT